MGHSGLRILAAARWRLRALLRLLPAKKPGRVLADEDAGARIAYLFAGTYGDFAQALRPLARLAEAYPRAEVILVGGSRIAREFAGELPASLRIARGGEIGRWIFRRVDLLATNCVGVYRVRFDWIARFCARRAFGFSHAGEARRGGYTATLPLVPEARSFARENLNLLDLAGVPGNASRPALSGTRNAGGEGGILFHIGSAGLKRDFGLRTYARLVLSILNGLRGRRIEVVMGPGDEDIAWEVRSGAGLAPQMYPMGGLIRRLRAYEGTVLCFNSFPAHLCQYLGKPAVVIHREHIPYGYDCAPLHRQIVLKRNRGWDLEELWRELARAGLRPLPPGGALRQG